MNRLLFASGLLLQKQAITSPQLHFGLGEQSTTDVVTILWPNGMQNAEFALKADQEVLTEQRERRAEAASLAVRLKEAVARLA